MAQIIATERALNKQQILIHIIIAVCGVSVPLVDCALCAYNSQTSDSQTLLFVFAVNLMLVEIGFGNTPTLHRLI